MANDELDFLKRLYANDPAFARVMAEAVKTDLAADTARMDEQRGGGIVEIARLAGGLLKNEYRIANFSVNGWDTHLNQKNQFALVVKNLVSALTTLKDTLGHAVWKQTIILAMTEFGRTVRENGTAGTDHGTGSVAILTGGAIDGGKVLGQWPGLGEAQLLDGRDLMPTSDIREIAGAMLYRQFDIPFSDLTTTIFPGLALDRSSPFLRI